MSIEDHDNIKILASGFTERDHYIKYMKDSIVNVHVWGPDYLFVGPARIIESRPEINNHKIEFIGKLHDYIKDYWCGVNKNKRVFEVGNVCINPNSVISQLKIWDLK